MIIRESGGDCESQSHFSDCDQVGSVRQEKYKAIRRKINSKFPTISSCSKLKVDNYFVWQFFNPIYIVI